MSIAAVVLAKNEEQEIGACLESLKWCDEVLVIDDESHDATVSIATDQGARVLTRAMSGGFAAQRNFGLENISSEWVLFVDADERVSDELSREIQRFVDQGKFDGARLHRVDTFVNRDLTHGDTGDWAEVRLGRRTAGVWKGAVHEVWGIDIVSTLKAPLSHLSHRTLSDFLTAVNTYSTLRAEELWAAGVSSSLWSIGWRTKAKFLHLYLWKSGWRDGTHGYVHALIMSFYTFLVRSKLYLLQEGITKPTRVS